MNKILICPICKKGFISNYGNRKYCSIFCRNQRDYKEYRKNWQIENKDKMVGYNRKYRQSHKEKVNAYKRYWNGTPNGKKSHLETNKRWRKKYPEKKRHQWMMDYARKKKIEGTFSLSQWEDLKKKFDNRCAICGEYKLLTIDHIIPVTKNGTNYIWNIQPLCRECNSRKNNRIYA
jgi:5-methylcytosine-specific restriction endonuclease McrA